MKPTDLQPIDPVDFTLGPKVQNQADTEAAKRAAERLRSRSGPPTEKTDIVVGPDGKLGTNLPVPPVA